MADNDKARPYKSQGVHRKGPRTQLVSIDPDTPGYKLVLMLYERAKDRSISISELAEQTGISQSTLSHLRTGRRHATELERESIEALASWMELPVLAILILAEQVSITDFYVHGTEGEAMEKNIRRALRFIRDDPEWGGLMPREAETGSTELKMWVIWCYESATGTKLLSGGVDYFDLLKQMEAFREETPQSE